MIAIDHVQLAMPPGGEDAARAFYCTVLGLNERQKPLEFAARGGCWFESGALRLHLGVDDEFRPAQKAHTAFAIGDLPEIAARLQIAGAAMTPAEPLAGREHFYANDPFGNRFEFIVAEAPVA